MRVLTKAENTALAAIAQRYGYLVTRGPTAKDGAKAGNPIELILAIISGEVATVLLGDEERRHAINALLASDDEVLQDIGHQLFSAAKQEDEA